MKLTPTQQEACQSLKDVLAGERPRESKDDMWLLIDHDTCMGFENSELEDSEDGEYEDLEENEQGNMEARPDLIENPVQRYILDVSPCSHIFLRAQTTNFTPLSCDFLSSFH
jgi:hypothetical protein